MLNGKMSDDKPPPRAVTAPGQIQTSPLTEVRKTHALSWLKRLVLRGADNSNSLQDVIEDYLEERKDEEPSSQDEENEKTLIVNVLKAHDLKVADVMVPRADIVAVPKDADLESFRAIFEEKQFSRFPVYDGNLDHVIGTIHIKDILGCVLAGKNCLPKDLVRDAMIVNPGLPVMELFLMMRNDKKHMALVVDEHGGIDGLVTLNDIVEEIVGDIEDEFDSDDDQPKIIEKPDGSLIADARVEMEDFEDRFGAFLSSEEREDIETLGGLAFELAGRVPRRGETLKHPSGMVLEIVDANSSRVTRVRVRSLPHVNDADSV